MLVESERFAQLVKHCNSKDTSHCLKWISYEQTDGRSFLSPSSICVNGGYNRDKVKICIADTKNTRDAPKGASRCSFSAVSSSRLPQPVLELLQGDDLPVAFLFHLSGLFAPGIELLVGDTAGLDPGKAFLVLLAVGLEHRIVRLFLGPLLEGPGLPAGSAGRRPLGAHSTPR